MCSQSKGAGQTSQLDARPISATQGEPNQGYPQAEHGHLMELWLGGMDRDKGEHSRPGHVERPPTGDSNFPAH